MKRSSVLVSGVSLLTALVLGAFSVGNARGASEVTVRGDLKKIYPGPVIKAVPNHQVSVNCGGVVKIATTDANGLYTVIFNEAGCGAYAPVYTKTTVDGSIMTRQVWVAAENRATIDLRF